MKWLTVVVAHVLSAGASLRFVVVISDGVSMQFETA